MNKDQRNAQEPSWTARQARFSLLCERELLGDRPAAGAGIGTYKEKRLHAVLKDFYCPSGAQEEVKLTEAHLVGAHTELTDAATRRAADRYVADIMTDDGHIFEIQTGGFYPLIKKLHFYLCATNCRVTVVHPVAHIKWLRWMDEATGELTERRRSPKKGRVRDIAKELYWLAPYLAEPRLTLCIPLIELEETRLLDGWGSGGKRGSTRYDRFPLALCDEVTLSQPSDYAAIFLPPEDALPSPFTAAQYAKATAIRGKATYAMLHILSDLGFLTPAEKQGRAQTWKRT